jgi:hypothetical protein
MASGLINHSFLNTPVTMTEMQTREYIFRCLATSHLFQFFGVPSPLHRDLGSGVIDVT